MIANLDTLACCSKEPWMNPLQPTIQQGIAQLKDFITRLVSCDDAEGESPPLDLLYYISISCLIDLWGEWHCLHYISIGHLIGWHGIGTLSLDTSGIIRIHMSDT